MLTLELDPLQLALAHANDWLQYRNIGVVTNRDCGGLKIIGLYPKKLVVPANSCLAGLGVGDFVVVDEFVGDTKPEDDDRGVMFAKVWRLAPDNVKKMIEGHASYLKHGSYMSLRRELHFQRSGREGRKQFGIFREAYVLRRETPSFSLEYVEQEEKRIELVNGVKHRTITGEPTFLLRGVERNELSNCDAVLVGTSFRGPKKERFEEKVPVVCVPLNKMSMLGVIGFGG